MKSHTVSLRRRHLLIAGASAPAAFIAAQCGAAGSAPAAGLPASASSATEPLIVSGRMLDTSGSPLAGALLEVLDSGSKVGASATTDADGRFLFTSTLPRETLDYRVSRPGQETVVNQLHFAHQPGVPDDRAARLQRDEAGAWRTTFGLTLA